MAQCHLALRQFDKALLFFRLLWYYARTRGSTEHTLQAHLGMGTTLWAQARLRLDTEMGNDSGGGAAARGGAGGAALLKRKSLGRFVRSLQIARFWLAKNSPPPPVIHQIKELQLYADSSLRTAFVEYDMVRHRLPGFLASQAAPDGGVGVGPVLSPAQRGITSFREFVKSQIITGRSYCQYCHHTRNDEDEMLMCSGCGVARFCSREHQSMCSDKLGARTGRHVVPHRRVCALLRQFKKISQSPAEPTDGAAVVELFRAYQEGEREFLARGGIY